MSVYKEGWYAVERLYKLQQPVFNDAADFGVPVLKGDKNWNLAAQLVEFYGVKETRKVDTYETGKMVSVIVELMEEGDVKRGLVTKFRVEFVSHKRTNRCHFDGYVTVEMVDIVN